MPSLLSLSLSDKKSSSPMLRGWTSVMMEERLPRRDCGRESSSVLRLEVELAEAME